MDVRKDAVGGPIGERFHTRYFFVLSRVPQDGVRRAFTFGTPLLTGNGNWHHSKIGTGLSPDFNEKIMRTFSLSDAPPVFKYANLAWNFMRRHGMRYSVGLLWRELLFDLRYRVDTMSPCKLESLSIASGTIDSSVQYQGADPRLVRELFELLAPKSCASTFVDFGCGKGRVLILAALHGFEKVWGVEFASELASACRRNLGKTRALFQDGRVEIFEGDAAEFELPAGAITAFLYNPFVGNPLREVVERLKQRANGKPEAVQIIYVNPVALQVFLDAGFLVDQKISLGGQSLAVILRMPSLASDLV